MRKVVLGVAVTVDGYIARRDGGVDFLVADPEYDYAGYMKAFDTWLLGRKTIDDVFRMIGREEFDSMGLRCYVFSRTRAPGAGPGFEYTDAEPAEFVKGLREQPGKDLWLGGGGELVRAFLNEDLVDRMDIKIAPVLLGDGIPLFPAGFPERKWRLIESRVYTKTGGLAVSYERAR